MTRVTIVGSIPRDLRSAYRALRATPGFTVAVLVVMTLAMGATTAVVSVVDAVTLRGLPFPESHRLVSFDRRTSEGVVITSYAAPDFLTFRAGQDVFEGLAAIASGTLALRRDSARDPEILQMERVSAEFFTVLRAGPAQGRAFTVENEVDGHDRVAVISDGLWRRRFGGAADILGQRLPAERGDVEIIGVMPAGFAYPVGAPQPTDVWVPYVIPERERTARIAAYLKLIARLKDGVTTAGAQARIDQIAATSAAQGTRVGVREAPTLRDLHESLTGYARSWLLMLLGAVACVLLIACANIANLLLVRATIRTREFAVRTALGATRRDLARLLLAESLLLSVTGTAMGVLVAWWGVDTLRAFLPPDLPRLSDIAIDARVLAASGIAAVVTGIGFGLAPMVHGTASATQALADASRTNTASARRQWLRATLLVAEVALAVVLLVATALFLTSFATLMRVDLGLDARHVLTVDVRPGAGTAASGMPNVLARVSSIPGVQAAALATANLPFSLTFSSAPLSLPGRALPEGVPGSIGVSAVSPDYFAVLRVSLRRGRSFTAADGEAGATVVILNETAARMLFPGEEPIGQSVAAGFGSPRTVIGVVADVRAFGPERAIEPQAFTPIPRGQATRGTLLIRMMDDRSSIVPQVKAAIWSEFPDLAIPAPRMLEVSLGRLIAERRISMILLGVFGLLGLAIAATGIYGVMSYVVAQRRREFGIRMALGAATSTILMSVLRRASLQVAIGLSIGLGVSWLVARSAETFLFQVESHDLRLFAGVALVLIGTALAAALAPARRAARVDPLVALRSE